MMTKAGAARLFRAKSKGGNILCGGAMIRISLPYIYNLAMALEKLSEIKQEDKISNHWIALAWANISLDQLFNKSVFSSSLRSSRVSAVRMMEELDGFANENDADKTFGFDWHAFNNLFIQFKTIFLAELETLNAHFVTQKRGYDTMALIDYAEVIFPPELTAKVPESIPDIREAGKCIAFELNTAAAFHLHRAHEAVLHQYFDAVTGGKPRPSSRNIGDYLNALKQYNVGEPK
ncbi:MAG: hypothetical protein RIB59_14185, partial [Rhodospirillales bacterium]